MDSTYFSQLELSPKESLFPGADTLRRLGLKRRAAMLDGGDGRSRLQALNDSRNAKYNAATMSQSPGEPWTDGLAVRKPVVHMVDDDIGRNLLASILHNDIIQMSLVIVMLREYCE